MQQFRKALFVGFALSMIPPSPSVLGKDDPASKVRGRIQDYERAKRCSWSTRKTTYSRRETPYARRSSSTSSRPSDR